MPAGTGAVLLAREPKSAVMLENTVTTPPLVWFRHRISDAHGVLARRIGSGIDAGARHSAYGAVAARDVIHRERHIGGVGNIAALRLEGLLAAHWNRRHEGVDLVIGRGADGE